MLFAVVALLWHGSDVWQHAAPIPDPGRTTAVWWLTLAEIVGGVGIMVPRTARAGAVVLALVWALLSAACLPAIAGAPREYDRYGDFFETFAPVCGAIAVYAMSGSRAARTTALRATARIGFACCAFSFGTAQIVYLKFTASLVPAWIPPSGTFWAVVTTVAFALGAVATAVNVRARLAMRLTAVMIGLFGILVWIPQLVAHPRAFADWSEFAETFLIAGAASAAAAAQRS